jgi:hypothetical protein
MAIGGLGIAARELTNYLVRETRTKAGGSCALMSLISIEKIFFDNHVD